MQKKKKGIQRIPSTFERNRGVVAWNPQQQQFPYSSLNSPINPNLGTE